MSEYKFKMTIGSYEKIIKIRNGSEEVEIPLIYPTMRESASFWKVVDLIINYSKELGIKSKADLNNIDELENKLNKTGSQISKIKELIINLEDYVVWSIEKKQGTPLSDDEKRALFFLLEQENNMDIMLNGINDLLDNIVPRDFQKATSKAKEISDSESKSQ